MEQLVLKDGVCAMASTDFCESQEDCYQCLHGKKIRLRLSYYEELQEAKLLYVLPVPLGSTIYVLRGMSGLQKHKRWISAHRFTLQWVIDFEERLGKDIFKTYEEAERAMKK